MFLPAIGQGRKIKHTQSVIITNKVLLSSSGNGLQVPKKGGATAPECQKSIENHLYCLPWCDCCLCGFGRVIAPIWARKREGMASRPEIRILDESVHSVVYSTHAY